MNIGLELKSVMNLIVRYIHRSSEYEEISMQQAAIVRYLTEHPQKEINSKDLEKVFSMRGSTCSRMLTSMENNQLIERIDDPKDTRKKVIKPTKKSYDFIASIKSKFDKLELKLKENISDDDLEVFLRVINQIKTNLKIEDEVSKC